MSHRFGRGPFGAYGNDLVGRSNDVVGNALAMLGLSNPSVDAALLQHPMVQAALRGAAAGGAAGYGIDNAGLAQKLQLGVAKSTPAIPLGCNSTDTPGTNIDAATKKVKAGLVCEFTVSSSVPLRPKDYQVSPTISGFFMIVDIQIAMRSFKPSAASIPATIFNPDSVRPALNMPILWPGAPMIVTVQNVDAADQFFFSAFQSNMLAGPSDLTDSNNAAWLTQGYR